MPTSIARDERSPPVRVYVTLPDCVQRRAKGARVKGIDGWFSEDEGRWYARFARALHGGTLVEVGSWKGRSTSFVGPVCNANGTRFVCVDHWSGSRDTLADRYAAALAQE